MSGRNSSGNSPDGLGGSEHQWVDALAKNGLALAVMIVILAALVGAGVFYMNQRQSKQEIASNALFNAQKALEGEMKSLAEADAPKDAAAAPGAKGAKGAKDAKPDASKVDPESVAFKKVDVDAKFPSAVQKLKDVTHDFRGTRAAYEASIALGSLYMNHGSPDKALPWYDAGTHEASGGIEKATAWQAYAEAQEAIGKHAEAISSLENALKAGQAALKGPLLLAVARNQELLHDPAKARATYDQIIRDLPNTESARQAEAFKSQLGER